MAKTNQFAPGEIYHLYNRGVEKRKIFKTKRDYERFLSLLYLSNGEIPVDLKLQGSTVREVSRVDRGKKLVEISAYCLMPNHFHLLIREYREHGISKFMQKLTTGYTMYFNKKYERSGSLFGGTFKSKHAGDDTYLRYLPAYIHLNPVKLIEPGWKEIGIVNKKRAEEYLERYRYSSFLDYTGKERLEKIILSMDALPGYYDSAIDFKKSVTEWLSYKPE